MSYQKESYELNCIFTEASISVRVKNEDEDLHSELDTPPRRPNKRCLLFYARKTAI